MLEPQKIHQVNHIIRKRGTQDQRISVYGMQETDRRAVQSLPADEFPGSAVQIVPENRVADMGEMDPNLMGTTRFQVKSKKSCAYGG